MIRPYLHFDGTCREAMEYYQSVIGGRYDAMPYSSMPDAPAEFATSDRIMHSALVHEALGTLLASDYPPGMEAKPQQSVDIVIEVAAVGDAERIFGGLADGGEVIEAFGPTFYSPGYGMARDRFGTHWIVLTEAPEETG